MKLDDYLIIALRNVIAEFQPESSSSAAKPLPINEIFAPRTHKDALNIDKTLIVGNRGTGKSVWSGALADETLRVALAKQFGDDDLSAAAVELGFHQSAGQVEGIAPSPRVLSALLKNGKTAETIWTAVLLQGITKHNPQRIPKDLQKLIEWVEQNPVKCEEALRKADSFFTKRGIKFLIVFDALDRLGRSWHEIRPLTRGVLMMALNMQGFESMRAKVFMRTDQYKDNTIFNFPDASKLRAGRIDLTWHSTDLYGLLFKQLRTNPKSATAFEKIYLAATGSKLRAYDDIASPETQRAVFNLIAGEYMGSDHRRGRTYTWIIDHLADAFHETTPRSFLVTLQRAANSRQKPANTVIDHHGIREGVQEASAIRVDQLSEDYPWISTVLIDLQGLEVPCAPGSFIGRWKEKKTINAINATSVETPGPIELEKSLANREELLLESLENIGLVEYRSALKINMPDIFRVAAKIKRRGGVKPPPFSRGN
ncbi:hypothetical protein [Pseudomonas syringae]|uniref:hypothetical protein n=1 Tax=Pseudomonas syringae TaxID=317 RepID=UPI00028D51F5|nr:hypothetical protein [Pseudomonas syringae]EKG36125.1 hypothetical protein Pav037_3920 [Pseudomonas syringae pv. avellanae str. ISPaVe037]